MTVSSRKTTYLVAVKREFADTIKLSDVFAAVAIEAEDPNQKNFDKRARVDLTQEQYNGLKEKYPEELIIEKPIRHDLL